MSGEPVVTMLEHTLIFLGRKTSLYCLWSKIVIWIFSAPKPEHSMWIYRYWRTQSQDCHHYIFAESSYARINVQFFLSLYSVLILTDYGFRDPHIKWAASSQSRGQNGRYKVLPKQREIPDHMHTQCGQAHLFWELNRGPIGISSESKPPKHFTLVFILIRLLWLTYWLTGTHRA